MDHLALAGLAVAGILVGVGIAALVLIGRLTKQLIEGQREIARLGAALPDRALVEESSQMLGGLSRSLVTFEKVLDQLPMQMQSVVSHGIEQGLSPLSKRIDTSSRQVANHLDSVTGAFHQGHQELRRALLTVNGDGHLGEWVAQMQQSIQPLEQTATAVERHYQTSQALLQSTTNTLYRWQGHWEKIERAFSDFNQIVAERNAGELSRFADIEQRIDHRLRELADHERLVASNLSQLQSAMARLDGQQERTFQTMLSCANSVDGVVKSMKELHEALREQERIDFQRVERLREWQEQIQERIAQFPPHVGRLVQETRKLLAEMAEAFKATSTATFQLLRQNVAQVEAASSAWQAQQETMSAELAATVAAHRAVVVDERKVIERVESALGQLPSRRLQAVLIAAGVLQVILLGACVYGLLAR